MREDPELWKTLPQRYGSWKELLLAAPRLLTEEGRPRDEEGPQAGDKESRQVSRQETGKALT